MPSRDGKWKKLKPPTRLALLSGHLVWRRRNPPLLYLSEKLKEAVEDSIAIVACSQQEAASVNAPGLISMAKRETVQTARLLDLKTHEHGPI